MSVIVVGNAEEVRVGPGALYLGPVGTTLPTAIGPASGFDSDLVQVGFTVDGSEMSYQVTSEGVSVAERLRPITNIVTAVEMSYSFTLAQVSCENLRIATNSPTSAVETSGTTNTFTFPKSGGTSRQALVWIADDELEILCLPRVFAGGSSITVPRRKGVEPAAIGLTFQVEENTDGDDAWYMAHTSLSD